MAKSLYFLALALLLTCVSGKYFHDAFDKKFGKTSNDDSGLAGITLHNSLSRRNFTDKVIFKLNHLAKLKFHTHYLYQGYHHYFEQTDVVLPGFASYFKSLSNDNREHADKLMEYMNKRGGRNIHDYPVRIPDSCETIQMGLGQLAAKRGPCICQYISEGITKKIGKTRGCRDSPIEWFNGLQSVEDALIIERHMNDELIQFHQDARDPHLENFLEHHYLHKQVDVIRDLAGYITQLKKVGKGIGEYVFDKSL